MKVSRIFISIRKHRNTLQVKLYSSIALIYDLGVLKRSFNRFIKWAKNQTLRQEFFKKGL